MVPSLIVSTILLALCICGTDAINDETSETSVPTNIPKECILNNAADDWKKDLLLPNYSTGVVLFYDTASTDSGQLDIAKVKEAFNDTKFDLEGKISKVNVLYKSRVSSKSSLFVEVESMYSKCLLSIVDEKFNEKALQQFIQSWREKNLIAEVASLFKSSSNHFIEALKEEEIPNKEQVDSCSAALDYMMRAILYMENICAWYCKMNSKEAEKNQHYIQALKNAFLDKTEELMALYVDSYWPRSVEKIIAAPHTGSNLEIANHVKSHLKDFYTKDTFYILVELTMEPGYYVFAALPNQFICSNGTRTTATVCVYRSKTAEKLDDSSVTELAKRMENYRDQFIWSHTYGVYNNTGKIFEELVDVGLVFISSKEEARDQQVVSTGNHELGPGYWIVPRDRLDTGYHFVVGFP